MTNSVIKTAINMGLMLKCGSDVKVCMTDFTLFT